MANAISALNAEMWSKKISLLLKKALVGMDICEVLGGEGLRGYDTINRPYMNDLSVTTYVPGTAVTIQDLGATNEQLALNTFKEVSFYVDDIENEQSFYNVMDVQTDRATYQLASTLDTAILGQYTAFATTDLTNANLSGGTGAAGAITASTSNIQAVFTSLRKLMRAGNVPMTGDTFIVLDPTEAELLERQFSAVGFSTADATLRNGFAGNAYGVQVYVSNNLTTAANVLHSIGGRKGSISLAFTQVPKVTIQRADKKIGVNVMCVLAYGIKTYYTGSVSMFDINFYRA